MSEADTTPARKHWSETDKLALLAAVATSFGPPDWTRIKMPENRTALACRKMYAALTKDITEAVPHEKVSAKPKLRVNKDNSVSPTPKPKTSKRKRGGEASQDANGDGKEGTLVAAKRVKSESGTKFSDGDQDSDEDVCEEKSTIKEEE